MCIDLAYFHCILLLNPLNVPTQGAQVKNVPEVNSQNIGIRSEYYYEIYTEDRIEYRRYTLLINCVI